MVRVIIDIDDLLILNETEIDLNLIKFFVNGGCDMLDVSSTKYRENYRIICNTNKKKKLKHCYVLPKWKYQWSSDDGVMIVFQPGGAKNEGAFLKWEWLK